MPALVLHGICVSSFCRGESTVRRLSKASVQHLFVHSVNEVDITAETCEFCENFLGAAEQRHPETVGRADLLTAHQAWECFSMRALSLLLTTN